MTLTHHQKMALALSAQISLPTVYRFFDGKPVQSITLVRLRRGAEQLGLDLEALVEANRKQKAQR